MSLHYILDGYNIMRHREYRPGGRARDPRYGLIAYVRDEGLCGSGRNPVTVVFDGWPSGFEYDDRRFRAVFSGDSKADDRIKRMLETATNPKAVVVVSDDREIYDFARFHGATACHVDDFLLSKQRSRRAQAQDPSAKPELSHEKMNRINRELRERWLGGES